MGAVEKVFHRLLLRLPFNPNVRGLSLINISHGSSCTLIEMISQLIPVLILHQDLVFHKGDTPIDVFGRQGGARLYYRPQFGSQQPSCHALKYTQLGPRQHQT